MPQWKHIQRGQSSQTVGGRTSTSLPCSDIVELVLFIPALGVGMLLESPLPKPLEHIARLHPLDQPLLLALTFAPDSIQLAFEQPDAIGKLLPVGILQLELVCLHSCAVISTTVQLGAAVVDLLQQRLLFGAQACNRLLALLDQMLAIVEQRLQTEAKSCHRFARQNVKYLLRVCHTYRQRRGKT